MLLDDSEPGGEGGGEEEKEGLKPPVQSKDLMH